MKKQLMYFLFIVLTMNLKAQTGYDFIGRDEFYILRSESNVKNAHNLKAAEIKSNKIAEQLFGTIYTFKMHTEFLSEEGFTEIVYDDGLKLYIPQYTKSPTNFRVTSDKYTLFLTNGQTIKVGMKASELDKIFPKSFSKRKIITDREDWKGKATLNVYFSKIISSKLVIESSCLVFVLSEKDGVLEQFLTYVPD